jgi:hypothetical protein
MLILLLGKCTVSNQNVEVHPSNYIPDKGDSNGQIEDDTYYVACKNCDLDIQFWDHYDFFQG